MTTKTKAASLGAGEAASNANIGSKFTTGKTALSGQPHKRARSTSEQMLARLEAAKCILKAIQPCSVRAVCYQLFNAKLITDMSKNSTNAISRQLVRAREDGIIPWAWIVDETRAAERPGRWQDPGSIVDAAVRGYPIKFGVYAFDDDDRRKLRVWLRQRAACIAEARTR